FLGGFVGWVIGHYATPGATKTVTEAAGGKSATTPESIATAPSFTADELQALPTDNWPTAGGNLRNERYSPLTQLTASNIAQVKGVWRTHLDGSGFAVSVATGKIL